jgi:nucleoside-diphosphate-sugar epimerase
MKILVVGATGKTGELAQRKAVAEGHEVAVFGHSVEQRYKNDPVAKTQGDVLDSAAVAAGVTRQDAVFVCLGPVNLRDRVTLTQGARNICKAMQAQGVERVVFISAAGVGDSWRLIPIPEIIDRHVPNLSYRLM